MRISENEGKKLLNLPIGLVCDFKGKFSLTTPLPEKKKLDLGAIHAKASYYRVIAGEIVESVVKS